MAGAAEKVVMEEQYEIEAILDRKGRKGQYRYHIKWVGYDSDANTWHPREDLEADGYTSQLDEFDSNRASKSRKNESDDNVEKAKRSRSKTPERRVSKAASAKSKSEPSNSGESDSQVDESEPQGEDEKAPEASQASDDAQEAAAEEEALEPEDEPASTGFMWTWIVLFFLSAMGTIVIQAIKLQVAAGSDAAQKEQIYWLNVAATVNDPLPALLCVYAVLRNAPLSDFTNRAAATLVWIAMTKLCTSLMEVSLTKNADASFAAILVWQGMSLLALFASTKPADEGDDEYNPSAARGLSVIGFVVVAGVVYKHSIEAPQDKALSTAEYVLFGLALCAVWRAASRILVAVSSNGRVPFSMWLEFTGAAAGSLFAVVYVFSFHEAYEQFIPVPQTKRVEFGADKQQLYLPLFRITHDVLAWINAVTFMTSAVTFHGK